MSNPYHDEKGHFCSKDKASGAFFRECSVSISDYEEAQRSEAFNTQLRAELQQEFGVYSQYGDSKMSMEEYEQKTCKEVDNKLCSYEERLDKELDKNKNKRADKYEKKLEKIESMSTDEYLKKHKKEVEEVREKAINHAIQESEPLAWAKEQAMSKLEFADADERMAIMTEYNKKYRCIKRDVIRAVQQKYTNEAIAGALKKKECEKLRSAIDSIYSDDDEESNKLFQKQSELYNEKEKELKEEASEKIKNEAIRRKEGRNNRTIDYDAREKLIKSTCTDDEYHNIDGLGSFKKIGDDTYIQKGLHGGTFLVKGQERREISDTPLNFKYKQVKGVDCYVGQNYAMEMVCSGKSQSVFFRNNCKAEFTNGQAPIFVSLMDNSEWGKQLSQLAAENGCSFPNNPWIGRVEKSGKNSYKNSVYGNQWVGEHYLVTAIDSNGKECLLEYDKLRGGCRIAYKDSPFVFRHTSDKGEIFDETMTIGQYLDGGFVNGYKRQPLQSYQDRKIYTGHFDMPL